jgi:hypothetical protein
LSESSFGNRKPPVETAQAWRCRMGWSGLGFVIVPERLYAATVQQIRAPRRAILLPYSDKLFLQQRHG